MCVWKREWGRERERDWRCLPLSSCLILLPAVVFNKIPQTLSADVKELHFILWFLKTFPEAIQTLRRSQCSNWAGSRLRMEVWHEGCWPIFVYYKAALSHAIKKKLVRQINNGLRKTPVVFAQLEGGCWAEQGCGGWTVSQPPRESRAEGPGDTKNHLHNDFSQSPVWHLQMACVAQLRSRNTRYLKNGKHTQFKACESVRHLRTSISSVRMWNPLFCFTDLNWNAEVQSLFLVISSIWHWCGKHRSSRREHNIILLICFKLARVNMSKAVQRKQTPPECVGDQNLWLWSSRIQLAMALIFHLSIFVLLINKNEYICLFPFLNSVTEILNCCKRSTENWPERRNVFDSENRKTTFPRLFLCLCVWKEMKIFDKGSLQLLPQNFPSQGLCAFMWRLQV